MRDSQGSVASRSVHTFLTTWRMTFKRSLSRWRLPFDGGAGRAAGGLGAFRGHHLLQRSEGGGPGPRAGGALVVGAGRGDADDAGADHQGRVRYGVVGGGRRRRRSAGVADSGQDTHGQDAHDVRAGAGGRRGAGQKRRAGLLHLPAPAAGGRGGVHRARGQGSVGGGHGVSRGRDGGGGDGPPGEGRPVRRRRGRPDAGRAHVGRRDAGGGGGHHRHPAGRGSGARRLAAPAGRPGRLYQDDRAHHAPLRLGAGLLPGAGRGLLEHGEHLRVADGRRPRTGSRP